MDEDILVSPCDGVLSEARKIEKGMLIQAKNKRISIAEMLKDAELASRFAKMAFFHALFIA